MEQDYLLEMERKTDTVPMENNREMDMTANEGNQALADSVTKREAVPSEDDDVELAELAKKRGKVFWREFRQNDVSLRDTLISKHWDETIGIFKERLEAGYVNINRRLPQGYNQYRLEKCNIRRLECQRRDNSDMTVDIIVDTEITAYEAASQGELDEEWLWDMALDPKPPKESRASEGEAVMLPFGGAAASVQDKITKSGETQVSALPARQNNVVDMAEYVAEREQEKARQNAIGVKQWFRIRIDVFCEDTPQGQQEEVLYIRELVYEDKDKQAGRLLDEHMIPYMKYTSYEEIAEEILRQYCPDALEIPTPLSGQVLAKKLGLTIRYLPLSNDKSVLGKLFFFGGQTICYSADRKTTYQVQIAPDTIVIDEEAVEETPGATLNSTIIHECAHKVIHPEYAAMQYRADGNETCVICPGKGKNIVMSEQISLLERQAQGVALCLQLPEKMVMAMIQKKMEGCRNAGNDGRRVSYLRYAIKETAQFFNVQKEALRRRLITLGEEQAIGVLNYVNAEYIPTYEFAPKACDSRQTFTLSLRDAAKMYAKNELFRALVAEGGFVYAEGHFCVNDSNYVWKNGDAGYRLTGFARQHIDRCCLRFQVGYVENHLHRIEKGVMYRVASRPRRELQPEKQSTTQLMKQVAALQAEAQRVSSLQRKLPVLFGDALYELMKEKNIKSCQLAEALNYSERAISEMRNAERPALKRTTAVAICIALELEPEVSYELLRKAGIQFTASLEDSMYQVMLRTMYRAGLKECNRVLEASGMKPLVADKYAAKVAADGSAN